MNPEPHGENVVLNDPGANGLTPRDWMWAWLAALGAMVVRIPALFKGFWIDEYYTLHAAQSPLHELVSERLSIGHFPLYFIYAKLGLFFGGSEAALRLSSLLPLAATVLLLTGLCGALGLRRLLSAVWVLSIFNPYWVSIATEYRYMMLIVASGTAVAWATVIFVNVPNIRRGALLTALAFVLAALHPVNIFALLAIPVFLVWHEVASRGWSRRVLLHTAPLLLGVLAVAPFYWIIHNVPQVQRPALSLNWSQEFDDLLEVAFARSLYWHEWMQHSGLGFNRYLMPSLMALLLIATPIAAWRGLRRDGREAWRLAISLLIVMPLATLLCTAFVLNVVGAARYWCLLSLPLTLLLAAAWQAPLHKELRWLLRGIMAFVILMQFTATLLDRGDLQREAAQWIMSNHTPQDEVLVARGEDYFDALTHLGFSDWQRSGALDTYRRPSDAIADDLQAELALKPRLLLLAYKPRSDIEDAIRTLQERGQPIVWRFMKLNKVTSVAAIGRSETERRWVECLPEAQRPWGPSRGDF